MFPCETCGHPLGIHAPCNAVVGKGKKGKLCACPRFEPADLKERIAMLTDVAAMPHPGQVAAAVAGLSKGRSS